jgi:chemosensory pili system protein ChpA (sensor histidine kinase/response regulator)
MTPELTMSFLDEAWETVEALSRARALLEQGKSAELARLAHRLRGSAGLCGFPQIQLLGELLERAFEQSQDREGLAEFAQGVAVALGSSLERIAREGREGPLGLELAQLGVSRWIQRLAPKQASQAPRSGSSSQGVRRFREEHPDLWEFFTPESRELLERAQEALETWSKGKAEALAELFRAIHTLKGAALAVGCLPIGEEAHRLEDLLVELREGRRAWSPELLEHLKEGVRTLEELLESAEGGESRRSQETVRVSLERLEGLLELSVEALAHHARLSELLERFEQLQAALGDARDRLARVAEEFEARHQTPSLASTMSGTRLARTIQERFSELEFDRYTDLNLMARSLIEMAGDLGELREGLRHEVEELKQEAEGLGRLTLGLRSEVGQARLVPLEQLFSRMKRQVGDQAEVVLQGETVGIDAALLDPLAEALTHLVNNALVHALEPPEVRRALGKPERGRIWLRAQQEKGRLVIEVRDDGRGIPLNELRQRAVARGFLSPQTAERLQPHELVELIFLPGLSTAIQVSAQAGRGVGMDAVAHAVRRMGGEVQVETWEGQGTAVRLYFPQSLVLAHLLLVEAGGQRFAIPQASVRTLTYQDAQGLPVASLASLLGLPAEGEAPWFILVEGRLPRALAVERFLRLEQALLRPPGPLLSQLPYLLGVALLGGREPVLVLNPQGLPASGSGERKMAAPQPPQILLVDDSLSVRRIVGQQLRQLGYQVLTAADGQEALELLERFSCDAVITDLEMPRLSGYELLEELRRRPQFASLPVAVLTTRASEKHRDLALELGATAYLTKPANLGELAEFLKELAWKS